MFGFLKKAKDFVVENVKSVKESLQSDIDGLVDENNKLADEARKEEESNNRNF
jgi:hypothetical protein